MRIASFLFCFLALPLLAGAQPLVQEKTALLLMGTRVELTAVAHSKEQATEALEAGIMELMRTEALISENQPASETSRINRHAGVKPVVVSPEMFELIRRSHRMWAITRGAFDVTAAAADKLWHFGGTAAPMPAAEKVAATVAQIGVGKMVLDSVNRSVFLPAGMRIGFADMGTAYLATRARSAMQNMGVAGGAVNAGGNVLAWGRQATGSHWYVGLANARDAEADNALSWLIADETAVFTAGNFTEMLEIDGKRYLPKADPRTGYPVSGLKSVTVICPDAELAAALAQAVLVLGPYQGLFLVNQLPGVACLLMTEKDELLLSENLNVQQHGQPLPLSGTPE